MESLFGFTWKLKRFAIAVSVFRFRNTPFLGFLVKSVLIWKSERYCSLKKTGFFNILTPSIH